MCVKLVLKFTCWCNLLWPMSKTQLSHTIVSNVFSNTMYKLKILVQILQTFRCILTSSLNFFWITASPKLLSPFSLSKTWHLTVLMRCMLLYRSCIILMLNVFILFIVRSIWILFIIDLCKIAINRGHSRSQTLLICYGWSFRSHLYMEQFPN